VNYRDAGRLQEAIELLEDALERAQRGRGSYPRNIQWVAALALAYERSGQLGRAEPLNREVVEQSRKELGPEDVRTVGAMAQLSLNLLKQQKWADAEPLLRDILAIREKKLPGQWPTANAKSLLGGALLGQKKYAEAEPLLLAGYEGLAAKAKEIPPQGKNNVPDAAARLVRLYEEWNKPDEAAKWRKELEEAKMPPQP
jgi:hypothetical protein